MSIQKMIEAANDVAADAMNDTEDTVGASEVAPTQVKSDAQKEEAAVADEDPKRYAGLFPTITPTEQVTEVSAERSKPAETQIAPESKNEISTLTAQLDEWKKKWDGVQNELALAEAVKEDPVAFAKKYAPQAFEPEKSIEEIETEVLTKYGKDFMYDAVEARTNPRSDSARYDRELMLARESYLGELSAKKREAAEAIKNRQTFETESKAYLGNVCTQILTEYGKKEQDLAPLYQAVLGYEENPAELLGDYLRLKAKENWGMEGKAAIAKIEKEIDASKRTMPSPSGGAKPRPVSKQDQFVQNILKFDSAY